MPNLPHAGHGSNPPWAKKHLASRRNSGYNVKLYKIIKAIPHNSKCRYGERGAADAVPQLPERCLSRKAGIVRCCLKFHAAAAAGKGVQEK